MFKNKQHEVAGMKRPLSPILSASLPKRVRIDYFRENSRFVKEHNEVGSQENDGWGLKTWQDNGTSNPFNIESLSQTVRDASTDEDAKFDPDYFDAQYQQIQEAARSDPHTSEEITRPLRLIQSSPSPDLRSRFPESPTRQASSSPSRRRRCKPPPGLCKGRKRLTTPPPPPLPPAPQTKLLSSPLGATPPPLLWSSPRSPRLVGIEATHQQDLRTILVLEDNEFAYLNNIAPSPSDDVFNTVPSRKHSLSKIVKRRCDDESILMPVENPASGPISKWTLVARMEHGEVIGYPCNDFKFYTEKHDVLGFWDEMGNIKDIDGNAIR